MPVLDAEIFKKEVVKTKDLPPVVLIIGNEEALVAEVLAQVKSEFDRRYGNATPDFNLDTLYGDRDGLDRILDATGTLPLGSNKKLVVLHRFEKLHESAHAALKDYALSPNPSTCLTILWNAKPDKKTLDKDLPSTLSRAGTLVKCWKIFESAVPQWVADNVRQRGKTISQEAALLLAQEGGESVYELKSEIEKLFLFVGDRKDIRIEDVRETMSFKPDESVWDITGQIESGNFKKAARTLKNCLEQGEEPILILTAIARTCRGAMQEQNPYAFGGYGKKAPINPAVKSNLAKKMPEIMSLLKKTDLMLKSGHGVESAVFERILTVLEGRPAGKGTTKNEFPSATR